MRNPTRRPLGVALCVALGMIGIAAAPSGASAPAGVTAASSAKAASVAADDSGRKKKKKRVRLGIPAPRAYSGPRPGQVSVAFGAVRGATRYRAQWNSAPYGKYPQGKTYVSPGWTSARTLTLPVGALGRTMSSLPYGNPVYFQVGADNARDRAPAHVSRFVLAWPLIATPAAGDPLSVGTYNLGGPKRGSTAPANIAARNLDIVGLQESNNNGQNIANAIRGWDAVAAGGGDEIIYDASKYKVEDSGSFRNVTNYYNGGTYATPWAKFSTIADPAAKQFYVVSVHYAVNPRASLSTQNAQTGTNATQTIQAINGANWDTSLPVIVTGDFTSNREPWGDTRPAQPVFVRAGYWDSQASLSRSGIQYSTVNGNNPRAPANPSGAGTRADYIMLKGIQGTLQYVNVAGYAPGGVTPSDHNLIYTRLRIPR